MRFDVYFIRHAESAANAGFSTEYPSTIPLTETGRRQAKVLAATVDFAPAIIATSTFLRTQQTAEPWRARFPNARHLTLPMIHEFTYLAPAAWQHSTASQRRPAVDDYWQRSDPDYCDGEGAESFRDLFVRVQQCMQWLDKEAEPPTVIVSHGMFIQGVLWRCRHPDLEVTSSTMRAFYAWQLEAHPPNASVTRISLPLDRISASSTIA
jgi:broad specificity phosphatase PhoE